MSQNTLKVIYLVGLVVGSTIRAVYTIPAKKNKITDDRTPRLEWLPMLFSSVGLLVLPLIYVLTSWLSFADYGLPEWVGWVGVGVFAPALWLLWRSHVDLGRNWTPTPQVREGHCLVTGGVFRSIRHPMYAAHWLWAIAQALLLHNWITGPALLVTFLPLYLLRVPREERMLQDRFGEEYRDYMSRTGRVIPRFRE